MLGNEDLCAGILVSFVIADGEEASLDGVPEGVFARPFRVPNVKLFCRVIGELARELDSNEPSTALGVAVPSCFPRCCSDAND
jgi:hypothetical protein